MFGIYLIVNINVLISAALGSRKKPFNKFYSNNSNTGHL